MNEKWGIFDRFSTFASDVSKLLANVGYAIDDYNKYSQSLINMVQLTEGLISQRDTNLTTIGVDITNVSDAFKPTAKAFDTMTLSSD